MKADVFQACYQSPPLVIALFVIIISIIAVYTTTAATEFGIKKDDIQVMSLTNLVKEMDWLNDYEEQKIADNLLQAQIDTLGLTIENNFKNTTPLFDSNSKFG